MSQLFSLVSYNILAQSYINPKWYTHVDPAHLQWKMRSRLLLNRLESIDSDVLCLQEVEENAFVILEQGLNLKGYIGIYAKKSYDKPDGCATFFRPGRIRLLSSEAIYFSDTLKGDLNSGHLAQVSLFKCELGIVGIAGTHLKWDSECMSPAEHVGYRQIDELIETINKSAGDTCAWIVCGDLNAQPGSVVIKKLTGNGFEDAYQGNEQFTCNPNRKAKRIDYIFHTKALQARAGKLKQIDDFTALPSMDEPSDHLAIMATFSN